jgi:uncharacterized protein YndB with AHSA1/START domain
MENKSDVEDICIQRSFDAPQRWVFDAWTRPDLMKAWFNMGTHWATPTAIVDLKPGGSYHLDMRAPGGRVIEYRGVYTEVSPEQRLCFTWPAYGMTRFATEVSIDFAPDGRGTLMTLLHTGLRDAKMHREHLEGWRACLDKLENELPMMMQRRQ